MSNFLNKKHLLLICFLALTVGSIFSFKFFSGPKGFRNISSTTADFPAPKLKVQPWAHSIEGKIGQALTVNITPVGGIPDRDDQELRLKVEVTLNQPMDNNEVFFQWILPPEASLVEGNLQDSWSDLHPGQTASNEISVVNVSKEGFMKTISLNAHGVSGGRNFGNVAVFATQDFRPPSSATIHVSEQNVDEKSENLVLSKEQVAEKMEKSHQ